jgi:hypothetical protein
MALPFCETRKNMSMSMSASQRDQLGLLRDQIEHGRSWLLVGPLVAFVCLIIVFAVGIHHPHPRH